MTCEDTQRLFPVYVRGTLEAPDVERLQAHVAYCTSCREEVNSLQVLWTHMDAPSAEAPHEAMRARFYPMLAAYTQHTRADTPIVVRLERWLRSWWPQRPLHQAALSLSLLIVGLLLGPALTSSANRDAITRLDQHVQRLQHLAISTALQLDSASDRLQAVHWSYEVERPDRQILAALLHALKHDPNVNVRLATLDALSRFIDQPFVREGLLDALPRQTSPLVEEPIQEILRASSTSVFPGPR